MEATTFTSAPVSVNTVAVAASPAQPSSSIYSENGNAFMGLGITNIVIGVVCVILGIVIFATTPYYIGTSVWGGIWYIATGSLGVTISLRPTNWNAIAGIVVSTLSAFIAPTQLILEIPGVASSIGRSEFPEPTIVVLHAILSVLGFVEFVLAIVLSCIFCRNSNSNQGHVLSGTTVTTVHQGYIPQQTNFQPTNGENLNASAPTMEQIEPPPPYDIDQEVRPPMRDIVEEKNRIDEKSSTILQI